MTNPQPIIVAIAISLYTYNVPPHIRAQKLYDHFKGNCAELDDLTWTLLSMPAYFATELAFPTAEVYVQHALEKYGEDYQESRNRTLLASQEGFMLIKRLHPDAQLPTYATPGSVGMDLYAYHDGFVRPGEQVKVGTGIAIALGPGSEAQIRPRSGLALRGITCNFGTIDTDYRGEIGVVLMNIGRQVFHWKKGDRIAQMVTSVLWRPKIEEVKELDTTERSTGGFGSTGT